MEEFFTYNILNFFSLLLVMFLFLHANYYFKRGDQMLWKQALFAIVLAQNLDILAWLVDTGSGPVVVVLSYITNILLFAISTIMTVKISLFLYYSVEGNSPIIKKLSKLFNQLIILNALLLILSVPFKFIFYVDANNVYTRGSLYFITILISILPLLIVLIKLFHKYIKNYSKVFSDNKVLILILTFNIIGAALIIYLQGQILTSVTVVFPFISLSVLILHLIFISKAMTVDNLTKLQNKLGLELYFSQIPKVSEYYVAAVFFDIDNFKTINDTYGHKIGDEILIKFAEILVREIKNKNIVARIGGDEFLVVFRTQNPKEVKFVCDTLEEEVLKHNNSSNYKIKYSYGISINNPYEPLDKDALIEKADKKMYENKTLKKENTN